MKFSTTLVGALCCATTALGQLKKGSFPAPGSRRATIEKRGVNEPFRHPEIQKRADKFLNGKTAPFAVNGSGIPEVPFNVGESYAGLLPITDDPNETRKLFFWFFPSTFDGYLPKEIVIWLNGGPGCSSLSGLLTENGPFTWEAGTLAPVLNAYSWTNLTNMVWVEQPVGVGYSVGQPDILNEIELAAQFRGFWKNFISLFDMQNADMYVTGESYGGFYVPYIADGFIQANDTEYYNLKGIAINDPIIGDGNNQQEVVIYPYIEYWNNLIDLNATFMQQAKELHEYCNYSSYLDTYFQFPPPPGPFPVLDPPNQCDIFDYTLNEILLVNPCFNIYHITETCPHPYSQLGIINPGDYQPPGAVVYFNQTDVEEALHAVVGTNWEQCTTRIVIGPQNATDGQDHDGSPGPALDGTLARVIEYTNNTLIGNGDLDFLLNTNGTLLALQNVTWNGVQGFQKYPSTPLIAPYHPEYNGGSLAGAGIQGVWTEERGLTFYTAHLSGHELPGYAPGVAYRAIEILLGRVSNFSSTEHFTTQQGNFTKRAHY